MRHSIDLRCRLYTVQQLQHTLLFVHILLPFELILPLITEFPLQPCWHSQRRCPSLETTRCTLTQCNACTMRRMRYDMIFPLFYFAAAAADTLRHVSSYFDTLLLF